MSLNKYLKLDTNILLEWTYDNDNNISEQYQVYTNLNDNSKRLFTSNRATAINIPNNQLINIDPISRKYAQLSTTYNFIKSQTYNSSPVLYDKIKIKLSQNNTIDDGTYKGFLIKVYTYDYNNNNVYELSNYFFDNEDPNRQNEVQFGVPQYYDEQVWIKYIELDVPSVRVLSPQRTTFLNQNNAALPDTINYNLTNGVGLSETAPIFIQFTYITDTETTFGTKYYYTDNWYTASLSQSPEYETLGCEIAESDVGDFFIIQGTYNGSNENMDDFVADLRAKGKIIRLEYDVTLYEENIRQRTQTFTVTENFAQEVYYRPVITFSNTTAAIDVLMKVIDLTDLSQIERSASLGLTTNLFKYGINLTRIDIADAYLPTLYNSNPVESLNRGNITSKFLPDLSVSKVNYPILIDKYKIMVGSSKSVSGYKGNGLLEIMITPFDNIIKFSMGILSADASVAPYDLSELMFNSKIVLSFKSDEEFLEKDIFYETDQNLYDKGQIVFKVSQRDVQTLKTISENNTNFYITLNGQFSGTKTLIYSGKFAIYENVTFLDSASSQAAVGSSLQDQINVGVTSPVYSNLKPNTGPGINDVTGGGGGASADYADGFLAGYNDGVVGNYNDIKVNVNYDAGYDEGYKQGGIAAESGQGGASDGTSSNIRYFVLFVKSTYNQTSFNSQLEQIIGDFSKVKTMYNFTYIIENITNAMKDEILKLEGISSEGGIDKAYEILT